LGGLTRPPNVQPATSITPATACNPVHDWRPTRDAGDAVRVICVDEFVTTLPPESSTLITGCVVNVDPESPAVGFVVKTSFDAAP